MQQPNKYQITINSLSEIIFFIYIKHYLFVFWVIDDINVCL